jgi:hypothetical protein
MGMSTVIDGSASVTINSGVILGITSGTAVTPTSSTAVAFTAIPSWVKRITIMMTGVTYSTTVNINMQLGSGSVSTSGYTSVGSVVLNGNLTGVSTGTGTGIATHDVRTGPVSCQFVCTLLNSATNLWVGSGTIMYAGTPAVATATGFIALAGALDRVQINTVAGTATLSAGSINILYEG